MLRHPLLSPFNPYILFLLITTIKLYRPIKYQDSSLFMPEIGAEENGSCIDVSVNSKPDHPPGRPPGFAHSSCPGVGFSLLCLARGFDRGWVFNQGKSLIILKKTAIFALSLKQLSSSSFHMFIYARGEQLDLVPIYTITNTQRIRIYPDKLKFILVKTSSAPGQRKPNYIQVSYY